MGTSLKLSPCTPISPLTSPLGSITTNPEMAKEEAATQMLDEEFKPQKQRTKPVIFTSAHCFLSVSSASLSSSSARIKGGQWVVWKCENEELLAGGVCMCMLCGGVFFSLKMCFLFQM